jgi:hypothetical protein
VRVVVVVVAGSTDISLRPVVATHAVWQLHDVFLLSSCSTFDSASGRSKLISRQSDERQIRKASSMGVRARRTTRAAQ